MECKPPPKLMKMEKPKEKGEPPPKRCLTELQNLISLKISLTSPEFLLIILNVSFLNYFSFFSKI